MKDVKLGVTNALMNLLRNEPERYAEVEAALLYCIKQYKEAEKNVPDRASIAAAFHKCIDDLVAEAAKGQKISCSKGCAYCCFIEVQITRDEAELILKYIDHLKLDVDWSKIEAQAAVKEWDDFPYKERSCAFLGAENECRIYAHRPMSCRKYLVGSPPALCDSQNNPKGTVKVLSANLAEVLASALFSYRDADVMPKSLLQLRGKK